VTAAELAEKLEDIAGYRDIVLKHRKITDDKKITYVLKDGTRIHEDESVIAKLAASLTAALESAAETATEAAARLRSMEEALKEAHEAINLAMTIAQGRFPATARKAPLEVLADAERKARAALAGVANGQV